MVASNDKDRAGVKTAVPAINHSGPGHSGNIKEVKDERVEDSGMSMVAATASSPESLLRR